MEEKLKLTVISSKLPRKKKRFSWLQLVLKLEVEQKSRGEIQSLIKTNIKSSEIRFLMGNEVKVLDGEYKILSFVIYCGSFCIRNFKCFFSIDVFLKFKGAVNK